MMITMIYHDHHDHHPGRSPGQPSSSNWTPSGGWPGHCLGPYKVFHPLSFMVKIIITIMIMIIITIFFLSGGGGYIIQSPTQPVNPIEVFPVASPGTHHHHNHSHRHHLQHQHHNDDHHQHDVISRGPIHVPGLSNPRHDPWSAALLSRPTFHTGICHHLVLGSWF